MASRKGYPGAWGSSELCYIHRVSGSTLRPSRRPGRDSEHDHDIRQPVRGPRRSRQRGAGRDAGERALAVRRLPGLGVPQGRSHRQADGPDRLRHLLARRAPLPARGLRVHPQRADAGPAPLPRHEEHPHRLRLQHRAHVAPDPDGRGLRHGRLAHQRPRGVRRGPRLPHPRGRELRGAACSIRTPTASCSRSRSRSSSSRSTSAPSRTRASTTRSRRRCRIAATRCARSRWCRGRRHCRSSAGSRS